MAIEPSDQIEAGQSTDKWGSRIIVKDYTSVLSTAVWTTAEELTNLASVLKASWTAAKEADLDTIPNGLADPAGLVSQAKEIWNETRRLPGLLAAFQTANSVAPDPASCHEVAASERLIQEAIQDLLLVGSDIVHSASDRVGQRTFTGVVDSMRNLPDMDMFSACDSFFELKVCTAGKKDRVIIARKQVDYRTKENQDNPSYNHSPADNTNFKFTVPDYSDSKLRLTAWDQDDTSPDDLIGTADLSIGDAPFKFRDSVPIRGHGNSRANLSVSESVGAGGLLLAVAMISEACSAACQGLMYSDDAARTPARTSASAEEYAEEVFSLTVQAGENDAFGDMTVKFGSPWEILRSVAGQLRASGGQLHMDDLEMCVKLATWRCVSSLADPKLAAKLSSDLQTEIVEAGPHLKKLATEVYPFSENWRLLAVEEPGKYFLTFLRPDGEHYFIKEPIAKPIKGLLDYDPWAGNMPTDFVHAVQYDLQRRPFYSWANNGKTVLPGDQFMDVDKTRKKIENSIPGPFAARTTFDWDFALSFNSRVEAFLHTARHLRQSWPSAAESSKASDLGRQLLVAANGIAASFSDSCWFEQRGMADDPEFGGYALHKQRLADVSRVLEEVTRLNELLAPPATILKSEQSQMPTVTDPQSEQSQMPTATDPQHFSASTSSRPVLLVALVAVAAAGFLAWEVAARIVVSGNEASGGQLSASACGQLVMLAGLAALVTAVVPVLWPHGVSRLSPRGADCQLRASGDVLGFPFIAATSGEFPGVAAQPRTEGITALHIDAQV